MAVAIAAVGAVALTTRNYWWASVMMTLTTFLVAISIALAIVGRNSTRVTAGCFAVFSLVYAIIAFSELFPVARRSILPSRVTSVAWQALDVPKPAPEVRPDSDPYSTVYEVETEDDLGMSMYVSGVSGELRNYYLEMRSFYVVAHCLWTLAFGVVGALIVRCLERSAS